MRTAAAVVLATLVGCSNPASMSADPKPLPAPRRSDGSAATHVATAAQIARARRLVDAQIATLSMEGYTGTEPLRATFDPSALVLCPRAFELDAAINSLGPYLVDADGPSVEVVSITADNVSVAARDAAVDAAIAIQFEVRVEKSKGGDREDGTIPVSELLVGDRVVAFAAGAFREPGTGAAEPVPRSTSPGPLAALLADPNAAAAALRNDPGIGVITTKQRATGPEARALLAALPAMTIQAAREVRHATWGFVQAHLEHQGNQLSGQLIAVLESGRWSVVSVHYLAR